MYNSDKTIMYYDQQEMSVGSIITIFEHDEAPQTVSLDSFGKDCVYFGRSSQNDIVLNSKLVSGTHGRFIKVNGHWKIEDKAAYEQVGSTNGLNRNNVFFVSRFIADGDFIRIDDSYESVSEGVLFVISNANSLNKWQYYPLQGRNVITIGRDKSSSIVLPHVSVSKNHARIVYDSGNYYIVDNSSTNGVIVNNKKVNNRQLLHEKDAIFITNSKIIFTSNCLYYCYYKSGISVDATNILIKRGKGRKAFTTCNNVDLNIRPGELVAVIGGSGAGKSTILNCLCGYLKPNSGNVYINGINLYEHFDVLKNFMGYVPQSDIVYDNLTLYDMLKYTAKLRLPKDIDKEEMEKAIDRAIRTVELEEKKDKYIREFSGGQKKRASIAVELLSDPNLLFLDEPASGLDPGTERNLMQSLREMSNDGKTVILVTHSTLQLKMCDKIVFMGKGGNLCFFGSYEDALSFFEVDDVVDIYNMITDDATYWAERYKTFYATNTKTKNNDTVKRKSKKRRFSQLRVLSTRYIKLVVNDKQRLMLLLLQAPLLALLISFVADDTQFEQYEMTKGLLFALSCSAFWVGMLNAIQEICKEQSIVKREYMTGLSLSSYLASKVLVLGLMSFVQSVLITGVFAVLVGMPEKGITDYPFVEIFVTTFFTACAAVSTGLFVSSLFTNADRAMTVAPILLMPQILFSGLIFKLSGAAENISWFAVCRWSMEGYGTTSNLNNLPLKLQQEGVPIIHEAEDFFEFSSEHLIKAWGIMAIYSLAFLILSRISLRRMGKKR